jgi:2-(1,2-epoxy-1,2-dihydrophenyl)acetyl-CoA isomerase
MHTPCERHARQCTRALQAKRNGAPAKYRKDDLVTMTDLSGELQAFDEISAEISDRGILYITLNMPARMNALTYHMIREIRAALDVARRDMSVRCVVLRGSGRGFCAGDNLKGMGEYGPEVDVMSRYLTYGYVSVVKAMRNLPKPIVASVHGPALGAGFELALAADFRVVASNARMGLPFIKLALAGGTYQLPRMIGLTKAIELLMTGRELTGTETGEWGIATEVVEERDLAAATDKLAERLAALPTRAMGYMKRAIYRAPQIDIERGYEEAALNTVMVQSLEDRAEGKQAWLEKRPPVFRGV